MEKSPKIAKLETQKLRVRAKLDLFDAFLQELKKQLGEHKLRKVIQYQKHCDRTYRKAEELILHLKEIIGNEKWEEENSVTTQMKKNIFNSLVKFQENIERALAICKDYKKYGLD